MKWFNKTLKHFGVQKILRSRFGDFVSKALKRRQGGVFILISPVLYSKYFCQWFMLFEGLWLWKLFKVASVFLDFLRHLEMYSTLVLACMNVWSVVQAGRSYMHDTIIKKIIDSFIQYMQHVIKGCQRTISERKVGGCCSNATSNNQHEDCKDIIILNLWVLSYSTFNLLKCSMKDRQSQTNNVAAHSMLNPLFKNWTVLHLTDDKISCVCNCWLFTEDLLCSSWWWPDAKRFGFPPFPPHILSSGLFLDRNKNQGDKTSEHIMHFWW